MCVSLPGLEQAGQHERAVDHQENDAAHGLCSYLKTRIELEPRTIIAGTRTRCRYLRRPCVFLPGLEQAGQHERAAGYQEIDAAHESIREHRIQQGTLQRRATGTNKDSRWIRSVVCTERG